MVPVRPRPPRQWIAMLPNPVLEQLGLAESSWRKVEGHRNFAFGALIVWFAGCIEDWLNAVVPKWKERYFSVVGVFKKIDCLKRWLGDVETLWKLRNFAAHSKPEQIRIGHELTEIDLQEARRLTFKILSGVADIRFKKSMC